MSPEPLGVAIAGLGFGEKVHLPALAAATDLEAVALWHPRQELYRDKQVNGLPRFHAQWQPAGDDGLITSVIEAVCTEPLSS